MTSHWKAIFGVLLIFVLGFTAGIVCSSIFVHRKMIAFLQHPGVAVQAALERRLTRKLNLDENQKKQIHDIFVENLQDRRELGRQIQPQVRMVNIETFQKINSVLRPDQQETFRRNLEELHTRASKLAVSSDFDTLPPISAAPVVPTPPPAPQH